MTELKSISANIPRGLSDMLDKVAKYEERPKSYYIKKGLMLFLRDKIEDIEDFEEAIKVYADPSEGEIPFEEIEKELGL